jgi:PAS domain S-box-containing protein
MSIYNNKITDFIDKNPLIFNPEDSLLYLVKKINKILLITTNNREINQRNLSTKSCILVVKNKRLVGLVTERDIVKLTTEKVNLQTTKISEVMTKNLITLRESDTINILEIINLLRVFHIRHLPVLNEQDEPIGIITQKSIQSQLESTDILKSQRVEDVMTRKVVYSTPKNSIFNIAKLMKNYQVSSVVIVEKNQDEQYNPIGIITEKDIVKFQANELNFSEVKAEEVMSKPLILSEATDYLWNVHQQMLQLEIRRFVVVDKQRKLVGIITQSNILSAIDPIALHSVIYTLKKQLDQLKLENSQLKSQSHKRESQNTQSINDGDTLLVTSNNPDYQEHLKSIYDATNELSFILNYNLNHLTISCEKKFHQDRENSKIIQATITFLTSETRGVIVKQKIDQVLKTQNPIYYEYCLNIEGKNLDFVAAISPIYISGQKLVKFTAHDVTEQKQIKQALAESQAKLKGILEMAQDAIISIDTSQKITLFNQGAVKMFGYTPEQVLGKPLDILLTKRFINIHQQHVNKYKDFQEIGRKIGKGEQEVYARRADGTEFIAYGVISRLDLNNETIFTVILRDATERKKIERILKENENLFRTIFEQAPLGIILFSLDGIITKVNQKFCDFIGYSESELLGNSWENISYSEEWRSNQNDLTRILKREIEFAQKEKKFLCRKNKILWGNSCLSLVRDTENNPLYFIATIENINQQKIAQQALTESEEKYRQIAENIDMVFWVMDIGNKEDIKTWKVIYVSPAFEKIWGRSVQRIYDNSREWIEAIHPDEQEQIEKNFTEGVTKGNFDAEYRIINSQGEIRWIRDRGFRIFNAQGEVYRVTGIAEDITQQKEYEKALQESEERYRYIYDHTPAMLHSIDPQGKLISVSNYWLRKSGYQREEVIGKNATDFSTEEARRLTYEVVLPQFMQAGIINDIPLEFMCKNGQVMDVLLSAIAERNEQGEIIRSLAVLTDITEKTKVEKALAQAKETAESANQAKSEFLANMSHEIRTPLNAVLGFAELLKNLINDPLPSSYLNSIIASGKTLLALINDILDLSKIEAGKLQLSYEKINLPELIKEICQIFIPKAQEKKLKLSSYLSPNTPEYIWFDEVRLRQILFNLVGNALKFTDQGYVKITINSSFINPENINLEIQIEDTGIGIAQEDQERIFDVFTQSDTTSIRKHEGTGLGLTITKKLMETLGGNITVKSELNQGSIFTIFFPEVKVIQPPKLIRQAPKLDVDLGQLSPAKILVVDDLKFYLNLIKAYFRDTDHQLFFAQNGAEAITQALEHKPDVILLDLRMSNMDGIEVAKYLKDNRETKSIPIIIVTGSTLPDEEEILRKIVVDFVRKPISREQLIESLEKILPKKKESQTTEKMEKINHEVLENLPELLSKLKEIEEQEWRKIIKTRLISEVEKFSEKLSNLANEYQYQPLIDYTTTLKTQLATFDVKNLTITLENFPLMISDKT